MIRKRNFVRRKRRIVRRRSKKMVLYKRPKALSPAKVHYFKRWAYLGDFELRTNGTNNVSTFTFSLGNCPNSTEFTSLYDEYMIHAVKFSVRPSCNIQLAMANAQQTAANGDFAKIKTYAYSVIDYDDASNLTDSNTARQYETCKLWNPFRPHTRYLKPRFPTSVYASAATTGYKSSRGYIDCTYPQVPHYGVKIIYEGDITAPEITWNLRVEGRFYISCRRVR